MRYLKTALARCLAPAAAAACVLALAACDRAPEEPAPEAAPEAAESPAPADDAPTPEPEPSPTPFAVDKSSQVIVLCYHRFEDRPRDSLAITPADFEAQMQALKDAGIEVISMDDFLAWRRGEKNIPAKSALIGIDDGYLSGYTVAWPILQRFGYPFTMYIYTDYVKGGPRTGGQSMTWDQLAEMRDAGVDIGSHTISHSALNARRNRSEEEYREWLRHELEGSRKLIEENLGVVPTTIAYPYGLHNETVREIAMQAGYEAAFTVHGQRLSHDADAAMLGRYAIESTKPQVFRQAVEFGGVIAGPATAAMQEAIPASATMVTRPMHGESISDPMPELVANLASLGDIDPKSVEMRVSGYGVVPAEYDPESGLIRFQMHQRIRESSCTVLVTARANGRRVQTTWTFYYDPSAPPTPTPVPTPAPESEPAPVDDDAEIPEMVPAA